MEDWTDIIGEELENIEEPLPADDWSVLQQKYAAAQKRKKAAAFAWAGGITSVAAAVALVLLLVRPDASPVIPDHASPVIPDLIGDLNDVVAEILPPTEEVVPIDTVLYVAPTVQKKVSVPVDVVKKPVDDVLIAENNTEEITTENTKEVFDVIRDTTSLKDKLLADAYMPDMSDTSSELPVDASTVVVSRRFITVGLSGSTSDTPRIMAFDMSNASPPMADGGPSDMPEFDEPDDSLGMGQTEPLMAMMKSRSSQYSDSYEHDLPVSVGISVRFHLTDRLSVNTGLNYTYYSSKRHRFYFATGKSLYDKQRVHYLGIPVRLDYNIVNRKYFNMYLGAGMQVDKCIYAKVADERLHEKQFLFGVNGTMGLQVHIAQRVGLYFEPELYYALNEGTIETFRFDEQFVVTMRAGVRFNF